MLLSSIRIVSLTLALVGSLSCAAGYSASSTSAPEARTGWLEGKVQLKRGKFDLSDSSGVVIVIEDVKGERAPDATADVLEIRQRDKQFEPDVAVVLKGSTVTFPNDDRIDHNVYSNSRTAHFDLGLYKAGTTKEVTVRRTGTVDIFCNVHPDMAAKILVVDTRYHAMTERDGKFSIAGIPPGTYSYWAWQPWGPDLHGRVTIRAGESTPLSLQMQRKKKPRGGNKDGTRSATYPD